MTKEYNLSNFAIGLSGTHRTDKTKLAQELSDRLDIPFVRTSTSKVFKEEGLDPSSVLSIDNRIYIQTRLLDDAIEKWSQHPCFVTDRTPIDMAAYMLMDYCPFTTNDFQKQQIIDYISRCINETNRYFSSLVLVPLAIPIKDEELKGVIDPIYMSKYEQLIRGFFVDPDVLPTCYTLDRATINFEERMEAVMRTILKSFRKAENIREGNLVH
ncbi:AAA family ATPase [Vibrio sp. D404a]|uniref:AAA family ATPase n=1 Tax=unclassified Vibrio TaxID=2614977 RepID=UPI002552C261|nr:MULTISPECIES: AAA family ATPase [unclassified Vibrio]MDK9739302.1 AAA family ATPase [Vibrio sp. D404a]MDK9797662.1 AAA family ATPase [Vibrio sp. D449a]